MLKYVLLITMLLLPVAACADEFQEIVARGAVRIGVAEYLPWTFTNRAGQLEWFDIDIGRTIAHDMQGSAA